jgi:hypothetical protein
MTDDRSLTVRVTIKSAHDSRESCSSYVLSKGFIDADVSKGLEE